MKSKVEIAKDWQHTVARIGSKALPKSIPALVDRAAGLFGDGIAWNFFERGERLTFKEVKSLSEAAAGLLRRRGVRRGDHVAVMVDNSPVYLICWLALARLRAAIVPVNTRYTSRELAHVLSSSRAKLLVIDCELLSLAHGVEKDVPAAGAANIIVVGGSPSPDEWHTALQSITDGPPEESDATADDVVNIQFTSGTTGLPKGCVLHQRFWIQAALVWGEYLDRPIRNAILNQRLFYIDGQFLAMVCLYMGTTFHICSKPSVAKFPTWLNDLHIDYCWYAEPMFKAPPAAGEAAGTLKLIHIFGFSPARHAALEERYGATAREAYGMSEFAPALMMPLDAQVMVGSGSCGLPAPYTELKIVDEGGAPVSPGEVGELVIQSPAMMSGYFGDPAATAQAIEQGWLKTGDLFRQDEEGYFYIVGRKKDMVRRNSENISCREVEDVIRRIPEIFEVAMVAVKDAAVGEEGKIYVQLKDGCNIQDVPPASIIDYCTHNLASFKIPRYIQYVTSFPMTESARVAKKTVIAGVDDLRKGSYDRVDNKWVS